MTPNTYSNLLRYNILHWSPKFKTWPLTRRCFKAEAKNVLVFQKQHQNAVRYTVTFCTSMVNFTFSSFFYTTALLIPHCQTTHPSLLFGNQGDTNKLPSNSNFKRRHRVLQGASNKYTEQWILNIVTRGAKVLMAAVYGVSYSIVPFERHSPWFFIPLTAKSTINSVTVEALTDTPPSARSANVNCHPVHSRLLSAPRHLTRRTRAHTRLTSRFQNIIPYLKSL